jgi:nicotinamide-nucleotide amidase
MNEVNASIITIGDELLIGQTIDTNSAFIAQELNKIGIWVKRRVAIGDIKEEILLSLEQQSNDCKIVIITGGLGPTADDITKPTLCEYFGGKLVINDEALQNVQDIFSKLNRPLIERNLRQAEVPDCCTVLQNKRGTAPGMWFEKNGTIFISLPGVPNEMKGLITDTVINKLQQQFTLPALVHRTLLLSGAGESTIAEIVAYFEKALPGTIKLAYLPSYSMLRLRLTGRGANREILQTQVQEQFEQLRALVIEWLVAEEDISIAEALINLLYKKNKKIATAESCTGGYIAHLITSIAGSSNVFNGSVVSYANEAKMALLDVHEATLKAYGAVSEQTVSEMARGALQRLQTDYALATSGIMGPGGGSEQKPVGTVWIAVASPKRSKAIKMHFRFDRMRNIEMTAQTALTLLYRFILKEDAIAD